MAKWIGIGLIVCIIIFVVQQSNLVETKKVYDNRLGVATDQTNLNWNNLITYFHDLKKNIEKKFERR